MGEMKSDDITCKIKVTNTEEQFMEYTICTATVGFSLLFFLFGSVRQIKLAIRQHLGARKYILSYRIVSYRSPHVMSPGILLKTAGAGRDEYTKQNYIKSISAQYQREMVDKD